MAMTTRETLTPREYEEFNQRKEFFEMQAQHELAVKDKELEVMRLEAKWSSWMKLPVMVLMLPVRVVMSFAVIISAITKQPLPQQFWDYMK